MLAAPCQDGLGCRVHPVTAGGSRGLRSGEGRRGAERGGARAASQRTPGRIPAMRPRLGVHIPGRGLASALLALLVGAQSRSNV